MRRGRVSPLRDPTPALSSLTGPSSPLSPPAVLIHCGYISQPTQSSPPPPGLSELRVVVKPFPVQECAPPLRSRFFPSRPRLKATSAQRATFSCPPSRSRVSPAPAAYRSETRNNIRSRSWGGARLGCSFKCAPPRPNPASKTHSPPLPQS